MDFDKVKRLWIKMQFGTKQRERVYRKLSNFLRNGRSLTESLRIMYMHASDDGKKPKNPTAIVLQEWRRSVSNGDSFGRAVSGWVPEGDRILLEAGEKAGLDEAIKDALFIQQAGRKIKGTIIGGMSYPFILLLVALGFMVMFGVRIVPAFETVLPRTKWTGTAADMALVADFVNYYLLWVVVVGIGLIVGVIWSLPKWTGSLRSKFDKIPPWSLYRLYSGAGFMLVVSAMTKAGVQQTEILRVLQKGATPWYDERITGALRHVANGENLGQALWLTKLDYPDTETVKDLRSYAELDGFDDVLRELGEQWIEESIEKIKAQTAMLRNFSFIVFGIVFGIIGTGIFALQTQVTSNM